MCAIKRSFYTISPNSFQIKGEMVRKAEQTERTEKREGRGGRDVWMWAVIRGSQQGGQRGLVGSGKSTTKQPFSSLAASLRGTSQAYLSSRLLNRLTSGSHPTHTLTHSPPSWFPQTQRNHDPAAASLTTLTSSLTSRRRATGWSRASRRITRTFTSIIGPLFSCFSKRIFIYIHTYLYTHIYICNPN